MTEAKTSIWGKLLGKELENNRFGIISVIVVFVGCLGGVTVGLGAAHHTWQLFLIVLSTMLTLSFLIAVAPVKQILNLAAISVVIDIVVLIINAL
jgi:amino acid transporter